MTLRRLLPTLTGARWQTLLRHGQIFAPLTLTRAQTSAFSTALGSDGAIWGEFAADVARLNGAARRLLIESQRTNSFANPRCEGAVAGTPGTMPSFWSIATSLGLTTSVVGTGVEDGIHYVDIRFAGTPTASGTLQVNHTAPTASDGQTWTYSLFSTLAAGSLTNVGSASLALQLGSASGNTTYPLSSGALGSTRRAVTVTGAGGTVSSFGRWRLGGIVSGSPVDLTVRLGAVQNEQGAFASTPIFPPVGSPGASTRGADLATALLANLGIGGNGACTILWKGMLPQNAPSGVTQALFRLDDGSTNNIIGVGNSSATNLVLERRTAGTPSTQVLGSMTAGTPFRLGVSIDVSGRAAASLNGSLAVAVTGGPTSGLTTLRLGNSSSGASALSGEIDTLMVVPFAISDSDLAARVAALPL